MSTPDDYQRPPLDTGGSAAATAARTSNFMLAELGQSIQQLDNDLESLQARNRELEAELAAARAEMEEFREQGDELPKPWPRSLRRAAEIEEAATARAQDIIAQAEVAGLGSLRADLEDGGGERSVQRAPADEGQSARGAEERRRRLRPGDLESRARRAALSGRKGDLPDRGSFGIGTGYRRAGKPARRGGRRVPTAVRRPVAARGCRRGGVAAGTASFPATETRPGEAPPAASPGPERGRACLRGEGRARRGPFLRLCRALGIRARPRPGGQGGRCLRPAARGRPGADRADPGRAHDAPQVDARAHCRTRSRSARSTARRSSSTSSPSRPPVPAEAIFRGASPSRSLGNRPPLRHNASHGDNRGQRASDTSLESGGDVFTTISGLAGRAAVLAGQRRGRLRARSRLAGGVPVHARRVPVDVPRPAVDDAAVRRVRHGGGDERALPLPARARADRALDRVRHADADGLRLGPSALARRGRAGGRGGRLAGRHGDAVRGDPARARCRRR